MSDTDFKSRMELADEDRLISTDAFWRDGKWVTIPATWIRKTVRACAAFFATTPRPTFGRLR